MSKKILVPRYSSFIPTKQQRIHAAEINNRYPIDRFANERDWFFFFHVDPAIRIIHAFGMNIGLVFFLWAILEWSLLSFLLWGVGVFFFYYLGVLTHILYDGGSAKVEQRHLITTFWPVMAMNFRTTFGRYDKELRHFIQQYPFTFQAHDLIEIERKDLLKFLLTTKELSTFAR